MDKDFLKEKLEELKAADTDIVEKAIAAFSAGATISEVRDVYKRQGRHP